MIANLCLLTCALWSGQTNESTSWLLAPRLDKGQEFHYRGGYQEESLGRGVQFNRTYRLENRIFVMDSNIKGSEVAFLTTLRMRQVSGTKPDDSDSSSIRLELANVTPRGLVVLEPESMINPPIDGPATAEFGALVALPRGSVGIRQSWEVAQPNRPPIRWKIVGSEIVNQTNCVKLEGIQQSEDWDRPRADSVAWQRVDLVWLAPKQGVAHRMERTVLRRDAAHAKPTYKASTSMELQSTIQYPGQLYEDRRREIMACRRFHDTIVPLLPDPSKQPQRVYESLLTKINQHLDSQPATPYRDALVQVRKRVELAKRGESPPAPQREEASEPPTSASLDHRAPDFVVTNLFTGKSVRLIEYSDRPLLMVFFSAKSKSVEDVLRFAEQLQSSHSRHVQVLGFAIGDDTALVKKLHTDLKLSFPMLSGTGLRQTYGVEATPKIVVIDATMTVRGNYLGWGPETAFAVKNELKKWFRPTTPNARSSPDSSTEALKPD